MATASRDDTGGLIGGAFSVDFASPIALAAPPLTAYAALRGGQPGHMAVAVARGWPARARALGALNNMALPGVLAPVAHGPARMPAGETGYFIICPLPPGRSLAAQLRPWTEAELMELLLRPAALTLAALQSRNVTHRAIRADNLFQPDPQTAVTLGCAWAAPAACHQPAWIEPPGSAAAVPAGRGDGSAADDVYALGALMIQLALGTNPVEGVPDAELLRRKLELGSYSALVGSHRLPSTLADLVRNMLADEPDHRPSPGLLANPAAARARRISSRPARRASRALDIGGREAWTARMLAHDIAADPAAGTRLLRDGSVGRWVLRGLADGVTAAQVDALVQQCDTEAATSGQLAEPMLATRAIALLDPGAPLAWRGVSFWPDGLGPALDHASRFAPEQATALVEAVAERVIVSWDERRSSMRDGLGGGSASSDIRGWMAAGKAPNAVARLRLTMNPLAPCDSPLTGDAWVTRLPDLLPALETQLAQSKKPVVVLLDAAVTAFIEARRDDRMDVDLTRLAGSLKPGDILSQVRLLARLQDKSRPGDLPQLSRHACELLQPMIEHYHSRSRREQLARQLAAAANTGQLGPIVAMLDNEPEQQGDAHGLAAAQARLAVIERDLDQISAGSDDRSLKIKRLSDEIADGLGMAACVAALGLAVFG